MRSVLSSLVLLVVVGCGPKPVEQPAPAPQPAPVQDPAPAGGGACAVDADCVPAGCCHPSSCVPVAQKAECSGTMCTMECQPGTLDCGGRCACEAGSCKAILGQP